MVVVVVMVVLGMGALLLLLGLGLGIGLGWIGLVRSKPRGKGGGGGEESACISIFSLRLCRMCIRGHMIEVAKMPRDYVDGAEKVRYLLIHHRPNS